MNGIRLYSLKDVQSILHVPRWRILYLYECEKLPEPLHVGGHRLFCQDDVRKIAALLHIDSKEMR